MKLSIILKFFLLGVFVLSPASLFANKKVAARPYSGDPSLIHKQDTLEDEGRHFEKTYQYDLAMHRYEQALKLEKELHGDERGRPLAFIIRVLQKQERYEEALKKLRYLREAHPKHELYNLWEKEIEGLIEFSKTKDPTPIYGHIAHIKKIKQNSSHQMDCGRRRPLLRFSVFTIRSVIMMQGLYLLMKFFCS